MNMTPERARELLSITPMMSSIPCNFKRRITDRVNPEGMTIEEEAEINQLWATMPGSTSFADALRRVAYR